MENGEVEEMERSAKVGERTRAKEAGETALDGESRAPKTFTRARV